MIRAVLISFALALLAGCATTRSTSRPPSPGGADANAAFAQQLRAAENETFEGRVDAKLRGENVQASISSGGMDGFEHGSGQGTMSAQRPSLGVAFYVYASLGVMLLLYLIHLLLRRAREPAAPTVRIRY